MRLTNLQTVIIIAAIALGTMLTRFLPFILFPEGKKHPPVIDYLGRALPPAMAGLLVVYCLRGAQYTKFPFGAPELISVAAVALLQLWRKNVLLSIVGGTALYMILLRTVFAACSF